LRSHVIDLISLILVVIGGINWGFVALFGYDPLGIIFGGYGTLITKIIYGAVGLAALWTFYAYLMTPGGDMERNH
jgi:uncharacterized membrane protein YuzA (DUF378 family)